MYTCVCKREFNSERSLRTHKRFCESWRVNAPKRRHHKSFEEIKCLPVKCPFCQVEFGNLFKMSAHKSHCNKEKGTRTDHLKRWYGWNRGLTKETHPSIARFAATISRIQKNRKRHCYSDSARQKMSEARIKYLESHPNHGVKWYDIKCGESIIKVQGTWEKRVAEWLNENDIRWERRRLCFQKHRKYTPDFYLLDHNFYIEVKGFWKDRDVYKMFLVLDDNDIDIRYIDNSNIELLSLNLPKFKENFDRSNIDMTSFKNVWADVGMVDS